MTSLSAIAVRSSSSEKERWKPVEYNSERMTWREGAGETLWPFNAYRRVSSKPFRAQPDFLFYVLQTRFKGLKYLIQIHNSTENEKKKKANETNWYQNWLCDNLHRCFCHRHKPTEVLHAVIFREEIQLYNLFVITEISVNLRGRCFKSLEINHIKQLDSKKFLKHTQNQTPQLGKWNTSWYKFNT